MLNARSMTNPKFLQKLRFALWLARLEAKKKEKAGQFAKATRYIQNRRGQNVLRLDVYEKGRLIIFGNESKTVTSQVLQAALIANRSHHV